MYTVEASPYAEPHRLQAFSSFFFLIHSKWASKSFHQFTRPLEENLAAISQSNFLGAVSNNQIPHHKTPINDNDFFEVYVEWIAEEHANKWMLFIGLFTRWVWEFLQRALAQKKRILTRSLTKSSQLSSAATHAARTEGVARMWSRDKYMCWLYA